ncbi:MAG TPA: hypothetical protein VFO76_11935 [Candidatus Kapabacteria bacterium]|nr:hypothetical protein [Candidatus Kapabacteria bacterium]
MAKTVIDFLASSLGERREEPNKELAKKIIVLKDKKAIAELAEHLSDNDKNIQSDCIKVLYEIGEQKPELIAGYDKEFLALLDSKNNRLVWGAMTALDCIAAISPDSIYKKLPKILEVAEAGSVITKDHGVGILIKLSADAKYAAKTMPLLIGMLKTCAMNQLPMYAENAIPVVSEKFKKEVIAVLNKRLPDIDKESKRKRVEKVIKKLSK